jgi:NAD(P)H dehydrogenase (quinone)
MHAPAKLNYPIATPETFTKYDNFLFDIPTRYGNFPTQWKVRLCFLLPSSSVHRNRHLSRFIIFTRRSGTLPADFGLKPPLLVNTAGVFVSSAGQGGGQESTVINSISTLAHHGIIYVPFGYSTAFAQLSTLNEVRDGAFFLLFLFLFIFLFVFSDGDCVVGPPWGSRTFAGGDGSRQPSKLELEVAENHGSSFTKIVSRLNRA